MDKKNRFIIWLLADYFVSLQPEKTNGPYRTDRDTHQITLKLGVTSLANGGPLIKLFYCMPVDYKGGEHP